MVYFIGLFVFYRIICSSCIYFYIYCVFHVLERLTFDVFFLLTDLLKPLPIQIPSIRCPCVGSCGRCEALRACTSFPHVHSSLTEGITPAPYTGLIESLGTLYRPAPLRPVPRGKSHLIPNPNLLSIFFPSALLHILSCNNWSKTLDKLLLTLRSASYFLEMTRFAQNNSQLTFC